jgi:ABC-type bacteriocin/lantibiotic exporter with double-glycine peptidase domain
MMVRSIVEKPALVIWQESLHVFSNADKELIMNCMISKEQPWTLLVSSGSKALAKKADRVVIMREGKVIFNGSFLEMEQTQPDLTELFYE